MANPRTINLPGSLADTQQYELAPGLIQYVQAVRVVVDNSGGGDATPTLSISEQSGVVIADVPQNGVVPAGEADGAATWALRLTDDLSASPSAVSDLLFDFTVGVPQASIDTDVDGPMAGALSQAYASITIEAILRTDDAGVGTGSVAELVLNNDTTVAHYTFTNLESQSGGAVTCSAFVSTIPFFRVPGAAAASGTFGQMTATAAGYSDFVAKHGVQFRAGSVNQAGGLAAGFLDDVMALWTKAAVIDRVAVRAQGANKFTTGSRLIVIGEGRV